jgi:hypothetical protein
MWPQLPTSGFISGRAATKADFISGVAFFYLESNGNPEGVALDIEVPQYAFVVDEESKDNVPVIVMQAETNGVTYVIGCIEVGSNAVRIASLVEARLLGTDINALPKT